MEKPVIKIEFLDDEVKPNSKKFLKLLRKQIMLHFPEQVVGPMTIDMVERNNNNAAAVVPFTYKNHEIYVYLRSCIRPAVEWNNPGEGIMWEIPAGVIDPGEDSQETAARELKEEMGFDLSVCEMQRLGSYYFSSCGIHGERIYLYAALVDGDKRGKPTSDGSILEMHEEIICVSLREANIMIKNGEIRDSKTIIALGRLENFSDILVK